MKELCALRYFGFRSTRQSAFEIARPAIPSMA
jgi:hypothetical protein